MPDQPRPPIPDPTHRPADAPDRFVDDGRGLIFLGSDHLPPGIRGHADWGPMRHYRLLIGRGEDEVLSSLIRWDTGRMRFARWVPGDTPGQGTWLVDNTLADYVLGDDRARAREVSTTDALAFIAAGAQVTLP